MCGLAGFSNKIFKMIAKMQISIPFITQASSEQTICIAIPKDIIYELKEGLANKYIKSELEHKIVDRIEISDDISIITIIGMNMKSNPNVAGKIFSIIGEQQLILFYQPNIQLNHQHSGLMV